MRGFKTKEFSLSCSTFCRFPFAVSALDRDTGYNMGSLCVLWFIWLWTLIQTIGDMWLGCYEKTASPFSPFFNLCFLLFQIQRVINKRLWDKYVYRRREVRAYFSLETSNSICFIRMFEFKSIARPRGSLIPLARNYLHVWVSLCQINEKRRDVYPSIYSL